MVLLLLLPQAPAEAVVEFGDVEDEPDYTKLAHKQHRKQQHKQQQEDSNQAAGTQELSRRGSKHNHQQQQGQQKPKQQLAQHKAGELTHAEPNVPAESRLQLFGAGAGADDSSWQGLGLSPVLSAHLEALNFQEPTQVREVREM